MKATASQKIRIGIFTIAGFAILLGGLFVIGSKRNMFAKTFVIYGVFRNIGGLQIGNNVRFAGINVGTVKGINIENDTSVQVMMALKEKVHPFVKEDAMASIGTDGLMGDKLVNISPGHEGGRLIADGGRINAANAVEYDKIINKISHVADNAEIITASLAGIATQINSGKGSIGRLIYSDTLERGLERTVRSAHETINAAHATVNTAQKGVEGFQENMEAMKHNFLLRGYYKKKAKQERKNGKDVQNNEQQ
jgi:phospholipid/cholesterol/gamma-HCH transport system substrate-binding protein